MEKKKLADAKQQLRTIWHPYFKLAAIIGVIIFIIFFSLAKIDLSQQTANLTNPVEEVRNKNIIVHGIFKYKDCEGRIEGNETFGLQFDNYELADIIDIAPSTEVLFCKNGDCTKETFSLGEGETKKIGNQCITIHNFARGYTRCSTWVNVSVYYC